MTVIKNSKNFEWGSYMIMEVSQKEIEAGYTDKNFPGVLDFRSGYIDPGRVIEYFDSKENDVVKGSPICKIQIFFQDDWEINYASGVQVFFSKYGEGHGNLIFNNFLKPNDVLKNKIDAQYVGEDKSGLIIPITKNILEAKLQKYYCDINGRLGGNLVEIERLAEVGQIDFSKEIDTAKAYTHQKIVEYYSSKEGLDEVLDEMIRNLRNEEPFMNYHEEFFRLFPEITFPKGEYKSKFEEKLGFVLEHYTSEIKGCEDALRNFEMEKRTEILDLEEDKGTIMLVLEQLKKK